MERQMMFHILGIDETKDEGAIRLAYRELLRQTNPEDDPEGFKRLREAYEGACEWARQSEETEMKEETEIGRWLRQVDQIYQDIRQRRDPACWKEILGDPVCEELDTSLDAKEALIQYLTNHIYLPQAVWEVLDQNMQILDDMEHLKQIFPANFLEYISYYIQNKEFINYHLFRILKEDASVDSYIDHYMAVKRKADGKKFEGMMQELDDLRAFGIYHPYEDAERIRILSSDTPDQQKLRRAEELADRLAAEYPKETYILFQSAEVKWLIKKKEEAMGLFRQILELNPSHYLARLGRVKYLMEGREYSQAKQDMLELLEVEPHDEEVLRYMEAANRVLIETFKKRLADGSLEKPGWKEDALELAWCLFQSDKLEEAVGWMNRFEPNPDQEYSYTNLLGRLFYKKQEYEHAVPHLERWVEMILGTVADGTDENRKRISRLSRAYHILGGCCFELGQQEQAEIYVQKAADFARQTYDKIACLQYLGYIQLKSKKYEKSVDVCDQVIEMDAGYFPAYVQRQEAYYELKKGQQVVDDYHRAVEIYPEYYKPYLLAAQVFFYCEQYEDARGVFERARENKVEFTGKMKLYEIKVLRNLAHNELDRQEPLRICKELVQDIQKADTDIEDQSEVEFETSLLFWDSQKYKDALSHLRTAISQNQERKQYRMVKGHILRDMEKYQDALEEYQKAADSYGDTPGYFYNLSLCYEAMGMTVLTRENLEQVVIRQDGYEDANEKLADIYLDEYKEKHRREDYEKAIEAISRQIALTENCYYLVHRGLIHMEAMEVELAISDYQKALEYSPDDWAPYNNLGYTYKSLKEYDTCIQMYERSLKCLTEQYNVLPYSNLADIYEIRQQYEQAIECYKKDLEWFPEWNIFWMEIGNLYSYLGRYQDALKAYKHINKMDEYDAYVGTVYYRMGNYKKALWCYKQGIWKHPGDRAERWSDLGDAYYEYSGSYRKAIFCYQMAVRLQKDHESLFLYQRQIASSYYMLKRFDKAGIHARKALEEFSKAGCGTQEDYIAYRAYRPLHLGQLGTLYICLGETEKGLSYLEQMTQGLLCTDCRHKGCYESHLFRGRFLEVTGVLEQALNEYEKAREYHEHSLEIDSVLQNIRKVMEANHDDRN